MLKLYLVSILVWAIIIFAVSQVTREAIKENGWLEQSKKRSLIKRVSKIFIWAAIPFFRVIIIPGYFYMAGTKKEK